MAPEAYDNDTTGWRASQPFPGRVARFEIALRET
jgi:hypothetical protein